MDSKFSLDGLAFENSTRDVIRPDHIMPLQEEAGVHQLFPTPPGRRATPLEEEELPTPLEEEELPTPLEEGELPTPLEEEGEQAAADVPENAVLKCILEDACDRDRLRAFQEYEHYSLPVNPESESDVPEDELADEMEDICSHDGDQLDPVNLQSEEDPTVQGVHDQPSPVITPSGGH